MTDRKSLQIKMLMKMNFPTSISASVNRCKNKVVSSRIFLRNSVEVDLVKLYFRLSELGMEYRNGQVCLADIEDQDA